MTKLEKMARELNDEFRYDLAAAAEKKFGLEIESHFDLFGIGRLVTARTNGEDLTSEQTAWLEAYSEGYGAALERVREASY